MFMEPNETDY
jgi:hypothetical protein